MDEPSSTGISTMTHSRIKRMQYASLAPMSSEGHPDATGILLQSGAAEFSLKDRFTLRPGELYVIPAGAAHAYIRSLEDRTEGWAFSLPENFNRVRTRAPVARLDEASAADIGAWLNRIDGEQRSQNACALAMREALQRAVYIECARAMAIAGCASHSRLVANALQIITDGYAASLRPRDIAARIGVTASHLSHELRRQTGRSPSEWIIHTRVDAAKLQLIASEESVSQVAEGVGYSDVSQLNRHFRRVTGFSPDAWRRANKA
jgi:AraC-like DNA-binding protein